ncbi:YrbL family protein [Microbulbifer guangxiensis]|uniref:YrbL family protein n=1 Tax=Microbulbifer guangxiensis TaxID=2904249 RepID=UPI001F16AF69
MIDLSGQSPFASGGNRHCFRHPQDSGKCVKVMRTGRIEELRRRAPWYKRLAGNRRFDDNLREQDGYRQRALRNAGEASNAWRHLARWYGIEATSEGPAAVTELVTDEHGQPAMTLERYLQCNGLDETIEAALHRFARWLRETGLLTKNILPHNLVIREETGQPELVLIDGIGCAAFLPLAEYFPHSRKRYIQRRIERMWRRIRWEISDRNITWKEAERGNS